MRNDIVNFPYNWKLPFYSVRKNLNINDTSFQVILLFFKFKLISSILKNSSFVLRNGTIVGNFKVRGLWYISSQYK